MPVKETNISSAAEISITQDHLDPVSRPLCKSFMIPIIPARKSVNS